MTFVLVTVFMTAATITWNARARIPGDLVVLNWFAIVAVMGLAFFACNRLAARWYAGRPLPVAMVVLMALLVVVATVTPLSVEALMGREGIASTFVFGEVLPSRLPMAAFYLLAVYVVGLRRWYAAERARAVDELVDAQAANLVASGALAATLASAVDDARQMSSGSRAAADELLARAMRMDDPQAPALAAEALRDTARTSVRGSSHRLWREARPAAEFISWRDILTVSVRSHPLPWVAAALLVIFGSVVQASAIGGLNPPGGLLTAIVVLVWLAMVFAVGRLIIRRLPGFAPVVTVAAVALVVVGPVLVTPALINPAVRDAASGTGAVSRALSLLVLVVGTSVLLTSRDSAGAVIAGLRAATREAEVERRVLDEANARLSREVAQHVHGTVQPGLMAAALEIEDAVRHDDRDALLRALDAARAALDADFTPLPATEGMTLQEVMDDVRDRWVGVLDVQCTSALPAPPPDVVEAVEGVVQECLNNAFIHGGARSVRMEVTMQEGGSVVVRITDDGSGPGAGPPGLGAAILSQATRGAWTLTAADGGGSVVRAVVPATTAPAPRVG